MSAVIHESSAPSFLAPTPAFTFFEQAIAGQLVNFHVFDELGAGWYKFKKCEVELYAPGWMGGYDEQDAARTPVMARTIHNEVLGVVW